MGIDDFQEEETQEGNPGQIRKMKLLKAEVSLGQLASEVSQNSSQMEEVRQSLRKANSAIQQVREAVDEATKVISFLESQSQSSITSASQEAIKTLSDVMGEIDKMGKGIEGATNRILKAEEKVEGGPHQMVDAITKEIIQLEDRHADRLEAVRQTMVSNSKWTVEVLDDQLSRLTALMRLIMGISIAVLVGVAAAVVLLFSKALF